MYGLHDAQRREKRDLNNANSKYKNIHFLIKHSQINMLRKVFSDSSDIISVSQGCAVHSNAEKVQF